MIDFLTMKRSQSRALRIVALVLLSLFVSVVPIFAQSHWVGTWASSQQIPEPHNALPAGDLKDATLRQVVHLTLGGQELRVRLSNRFGTAPLHLSGVHIAKPVTLGSAAIAPGSDKALNFLGNADVTIPAGADYLSDPIAYPVVALSDLVITMHMDLEPAQQTSHPGSRTTTFLSHGNLVSAPDMPDAKKVVHWYFISGVDVVAPPQTAAVVIFGDSITDGFGTTPDTNMRWTDHLIKRMQANPATQSLSVLNHGIGGNHLLTDGLGPNSLARFNDDVLAQTGIQTLLIFEGVNDLGGLAREAEVSQAEHDSLVRRMISALDQMISRAHANGIKVIGATITPFVGSTYYHPGPNTEADRQKVNEWIRTPGHFDAVIDFDKIMRDPQSPERLLPAYDCGDHLHPSLAGYAALAEAVPLELLTTHSEPAPKIAFTFDDLPAHAGLPPNETRTGVVTKIIDALKQANVPSTYGFVNGDLLKQQPADINVLQTWVAAGNKLGNHTWSHMNLNQHTLAEYQEEINKNEPILKDLMKEKDWRWFRYPFLARGDTPEKRDAVRALLQQHGYKIADVTMSFADYAYSQPYVRCAEKGDAQAIGLLEKTYLEAADESITYYRGLSKTLYGRDIPYVLLMHLGAFEARMMPKLLDLYRARGFQFVTLEEAESDGFYKTETNLSMPPAPDNLEGTMMQRGVQVPQHAVPFPHFDNLCN